MSGLRLPVLRREPSGGPILQELSPAARMASDESERQFSATLVAQLGHVPPARRTSRRPLSGGPVRASLAPYSPAHCAAIPQNGDSGRNSWRSAALSSNRPLVDYTTACNTSRSAKNLLDGYQTESRKRWHSTSTNKFCLSCGAMIQTLTMTMMKAPKCGTTCASVPIAPGSRLRTFVVQYDDHGVYHYCYQ